MSCAKRATARLFVLLSALPIAAPSAFAAEQAAANTPSALTGLISRLAERGVLSQQDSAELLLLAEADAAEARAQAAMTQAALAQVAAAQARARALAAQLERRQGETGAAPLPVEQAQPNAPAVSTRPVAPPASVTPAPEVPSRTVPPPRASTTSRSVETAEPLTAITPRQPTTQQPAPTPAEPEEPVPADVVRVTYIPENVRAQLRAEVKADVMDQAREENWASPRTFPEWVTRFRVFGDLRFRYEGVKFPTGNDNTGSFPNFNAINTGAPFDVSGVIFSPQYNVDEDRNRFRLRTRLGAGVDLGNAFTVGLRIGSGESNSPVSGNQSLGLPSAGQGGNFSKYPVWLDRAFLKYEMGGQPDRDFVFSVGRFDNPFFATSMLWADDLGFDGGAVQGKFPVTEDVTPFFTVGAFPVFNTDLNFASNQPSKFKSNDKWLYAAQLGTTLEFNKDFSAKIGAALYQFRDIEGKLSSPFTPVNAVDAGDTDASRPAFAQKGNTYMALRNITASTLNNNGTINQFQYFGLASEFDVMAFDARIDFNRFEPFQVSLLGEYVKNRGFDGKAIAPKAVNNLGVAATTPTPAAAPFLGGDTGWLVGMSLGQAALQKRWDWNLSFIYRRVESDAVVDGFVDSDFGGGGTNLKGFTVNGSLALAPGVWLGLRWMTAQQIAGPTYKNDTFHVDINAKF